MIKTINIRKISVVLISIMLLLAFTLSISTSYADEKKDKAPAETQKTIEKQEPSRSGSAPHLKSGITTSYTATGIVNEQYGFSDHWLEYYFEDPEHDTLDFYVSVNDGPITQTGITYLVDENNNPVTTYYYTPASGDAGNTINIKIYAHDGTQRSDDYVTVTLDVKGANSTDTGIGANFSAGQVNGVFNVYPDFSIAVN